VINRFEFGVERGLARRQRERRDGLISVAMVRKCLTGRHIIKLMIVVVRHHGRGIRREEVRPMTAFEKLHSHSAIRWSYSEPSRWPVHLSRRHSPLACKTRSVTADPTPPLSVARAHHDQRLSHPGEVDGVLLARRDVCLK
jgi:hypothetical protein